MKNEFTAIIEPGEDGWWVATCPEVPGTVGQGKTQAEARTDLASAIALMLEYLRDEALKNMPETAERDTVSVG